MRKRRQNNNTVSAADSPVSLRTLVRDPRIIALFIVGLSLRIAIASYNREANDDHYEVIKPIADQWITPDREACWQCYHPKLYHWSAGIAIRVLALSSFDSRIIAAQMVNVFAGAATLVVALALLGSMRLPATVRCLSFALIALNPTLCGINAQATNDSFIILFASLTIYHVWRYFETSHWLHAALLIAATVLAVLSKGSAWVLFAAACLCLGIRAVACWSDRARLFGSLATLAALIVAFLSAAALLAPYYKDHRVYGSAFAINVPKAPAPALFERSTYARPGVRSIAEAYFTFRIVDLVRTPLITMDRHSYARHRTSL